MLLLKQPCEQVVGQGKLKGATWWPSSIDTQQVSKRVCVCVWLYVYVCVCSHLCAPALSQHVQYMLRGRVCLCV